MTPNASPTPSPAPAPGVLVNRAVLALHLFLRTASLRTAVADARARSGGHDRGDVPGWVLVTVMTAGMVMVIWGVAEDQLRSMLTGALNSVR